MNLIVLSYLLWLVGFVYLPLVMMGLSLALGIWFVIRYFKVLRPEHSGW